MSRSLDEVLKELEAAEKEFMDKLKKYEDQDSKKEEEKAWFCRLYFQIKQFLFKRAVFLIWIIFKKSVFN